MNHHHFHHFQAVLDQRKAEGTLRALRIPAQGIDFYSNDYLGLARDPEVHHSLLLQIQEQPSLLSGSTGSRLISGNTSEISATEEFIADQHQYPAALLFQSGYNANLALLSTLPNRHDTIIADELVHRSIHDACKISNAKKIKFRHDDLEQLEEKLKQHKNCYVVIESLDSMDGDLAPLREIAELSEKYSASLIVDEAHAFGVFGYGLVAEHQLQDKVLATVITYGKALGAHGSAVLTHELVKNYLITFASPFIYSTSSQDLQWRIIKNNYRYLNNNRIQQLKENISRFRAQGLQTISSENSPIQAIIIPDRSLLKDIQQNLFAKGFLTYAVYSPTVKEGSERLRICLHSFNIEQEIIELTQIIQEYI